MRHLFTLTIFLGSFLLFAVQPMMAKMLLPYFGGAPAVWNTSMVFFQGLLLAGYAYAHYAATKIGVKRHAWLHLGIFVLAAITLPAAIPASFSPSTNPAGPQWALVGLLLSAIGLPYFVVASGAPLLQRWFSLTSDPMAEKPYFLYAASNVGSLSALLAYPFLIESKLSLGEQSRAWMFGFIALAVLVALCAQVARKEDDKAPPSETPQPISWPQRLRWLALSAAPSSLLLGVTNHLSTNMASMPLIWVVPLALYLITFVIAFADRRRMSSISVGRIFALCMAPMCLLLVLEANEPFLVISSIHLIVFAIAALACHLELAETSPNRAQLTEFYMWLSFGGVLGGMFTALLAPVIFPTVIEYPLALVAILLLRKTAKEQSFKLLDGLAVVGVACLTIGLFMYANATKMPYNWTRTGITLGIPAVAAFLTMEKPVRFGLSIGSVLGLAMGFAFTSFGKVALVERSFFGVHRIIDRSNGMRDLVHGTTIHGRQNKEERTTIRPLTYYYPTGPIGSLIQDMQAVQPKQTLGFVGLGVGSLAAYGRAGDSYTFFEIDPIVIRIASDPSWFTYIEKSKASVALVQGDARLTLQKQPDAEFDLLALDAFSSDAIPVHLMTQEAIETYMKKLKPDGILAYHISNRFLTLAPILAGICEATNLTGVVWHDSPSDQESADGKTASEWFFIARNAETLKKYKSLLNGEPHTSQPSRPPWTDDRSNIMDAWDFGRHSSDF